MEKSFIYTKEKLPEKGFNIVGFDEDDNKYYVFRCNCQNKNCLQWRCSITGNELIINIVKVVL